MRKCGIPLGKQSRTSINIWHNYEAKEYLKKNQKKKIA